MNILFAFIIGIILSTIFYKLGFAITRCYVDIKLVFFISIIGSLIGLVFTSHQIIGAIVGLVIQATLFKKLGNINIWPDFVIAFIVTEGLMLLAATFLIASLINM